MKAKFRGGLGVIHPHGALLALEEHDLAVAIASANAGTVLGLPLDHILGAGIAAVLAQPSESQLRALLAHDDLADLNPLTASTKDGESLDAIIHRVPGSGLVVLELERAGTRIGPGRIERAIARMQHAQRVTECIRIAVEEIRALVGFERVALYRHRAGIVELAAALPDDVPAAPIALRAGETVRFFADRAAKPVELVGVVDRDLELAGCVLGYTPGEPGTGALFAIGLGTFGVIVCEHPEPRVVPYSARAAAQVLARMLGWNLGMRERLGDELRASNMAKDEFLATVSHELRTPLNAMLGWLRLMSAGQVPSDRQSHAISTVQRNAVTLAQLVEELLDVSRVISGKMRIDLQPVLAGPIVEAALATVQPTAEAKGIRVRAQIEPHGAPVLADAGRLQQVVWNLLTNAIKFTPEGGTIDVALRRTASAVEIEVVDSGAGIDAATLPYVFERFKQGDDATTRVQGLGLGLAIVRHLVELHGGDVTARSAGRGHGATFVVRLPLATGRIANVTTQSAPPPVFEPAPQLRGMRVLAVDDEQDANDLMRAVLQSSGVEVTTARSATEALALLPTLDPHVLISDIGMPGGDGYTLIQDVRRLPEHAGGRIPAIAVTAFARVHDRSRAFLAGFDVYLAKPIDPAELVAVLCNLAARRAVLAAPAAPASRASRRAETEPPGGVLSGTRILIVDDDPDNAEMLGELLRFDGAVIDLAHTATEGMEKIRAFRPDVLVSDIGLPDKDGFAFVRELRALGPDDGGWIPAIALSGHAGNEHAREAILAGFQLHVPKPIDPADLVARLARLVGRTVRRT